MSKQTSSDTCKLRRLIDRHKERRLIRTIRLLKKDRTFRRCQLLYCYIKHILYLKSKGRSTDKKFKRVEITVEKIILSFLHCNLLLRPIVKFKKLFLATERHSIHPAGNKVFRRWLSSIVVYMHIIVHVHLFEVHHGQLQELLEFSVFSLANVLNDGGTDNFRLTAFITELTAQ